ncbi:CoA transferase [Arthrobacter dokdonensis]|uniref:CoA transferase n=1 Tax=Arthrobacter dokdonellae TaxID=2211210 RepID=UPI001D131074|nr:CoA transferase [Arthrobacter dokdonellae]
MARALGLPHLAADPRFATNNARVAHRQELIPILEDALSADTAIHWQDRLTDAGVPAGHVSGIDQGLQHAQTLGLEPRRPAAAPRRHHGGG